MCKIVFSVSLLSLFLWVRDRCRFACVIADIGDLCLFLIHLARGILIFFFLPPDNQFQFHWFSLFSSFLTSLISALIISFFLFTLVFFFIPPYPYLLM